MTDELARQSSTLLIRGMWKRSHGLDSKAPAIERVGQQICQPYSHRATSLLYLLKSVAKEIGISSLGDSKRHIPVIRIFR